MIELNQGFYLTFLQTCLCVGGCFIIFIDDVYRAVIPKFITSRYQFKIQENYAFMNASLSFSAGCLLFTALSKLLPEARTYLKKSLNPSDPESPTEQQLSFQLVLFYTGGVLVCMAFNAIFHLMTSESIVHCEHSGAGGKPHTHVVVQQDTKAHTHAVSQKDTAPLTHDDELNHAGYGATGDSSDATTSRPGLSPADRKKSLIHLFTTDGAGECKGYASADVYLFNNEGPLDTECDPHPVDLNPPLHVHSHSNLSDTISDDLHYHGGHGPLSHDIHIHNNNQDLEANEDSLHREHHHHVTKPLSHLLVIGIETTLAITLHKLPEGFITYITSETNKILGMQIFLSLMVHNFTEGFLMCLPLYFLMAATAPRWAKLKAFTISATLGGLSQPMGAILGYFFLSYNKRGIDLIRLHYVFGLAMAATSGFLTVVGLSMFSSAVAFNRGSLNYVMLWSLGGMILIGFSSVLSGKL